MYTKDLKDIGVKISDKGFLRKTFIGEHRRMLLDYFGKKLEADVLIPKGATEGRVVAYRGLGNVGDVKALGDSLSQRIMDSGDTTLCERVDERMKWRMIAIFSTIFFGLISLGLVVSLLIGRNTISDIQWILFFSTAEGMIINVSYRHNKE